MPRASFNITVYGLLLFCGASAFAQSSGHPDGMREKTNLRNVRYCEIFVVHRNGFSATASVYNTLGLNDCPEEKWKSLNADKLKSELKAYLVILNGPRYFMMDCNALRKAGEVETFDGLQARLVATLEMKGGNKRSPYTENVVDRESQYVYDAGKNVYELLTPDGHFYILQSYSLEVDPNLNEAALAVLGNRLKLPKGWKYQVRQLSKDLVVRNSGTKAYVVQDDLRNSYQKVQ